MRDEMLRKENNIWWVSSNAKEYIEYNIAQRSDTGGDWRAQESSVDSQLASH
jgi:hypothetical protein